MERIGHYPATAIVRHIQQLARIGVEDREKPTMIVEDIQSTDWASITFSGHRHVLDLRLEGESDVVAATIVRLADEIGTVDLPIAGHFVAEIAVTATGIVETPAGPRCNHCIQWLKIDALTIRD